jgi:hypothetical protein
MAQFLCQVGISTDDFSRMGAVKLLRCQLFPKGRHMVNEINILCKIVG